MMVGGGRSRETLVDSKASTELSRVRLRPPITCVGIAREDGHACGKMHRVPLDRVGLFQLQ